MRAARARGRRRGAEPLARPAVAVHLGARPLCGGPGGDDGVHLLGPDAHERHARAEDGPVEASHAQPHGRAAAGAARRFEHHDLAAAAHRRQRVAQHLAVAAAAVRDAARAALWRVARAPWAVPNARAANGGLHPHGVA
eukprot:2433565-Prymnesium_polylepis.1